MNNINDFIKKNQNDFYRFAYSYVRNKEDALDVVQDSVYKALKSKSKIRDEEKIKSWFFTIIRNTALNKIRKNKKQVSLDSIEEPSESFDNDNKIFIKRVLQSLEEEEKELLIMRFFEELKFNEISEILDLNINTIKSRYYKILNRLKKDYERRSY